MEVLLDHLNICFPPEGVDDYVFGSTMMPARRYEAEDVARAPRSPGISSQRPGKLAKYLYRAQHVYRQIRTRLRDQGNFRSLDGSGRRICFQTREMCSQVSR